MSLAVFRSIGVLIVSFACSEFSLSAPHTVDELLKEPLVRGVDLSPDGARIAIAFGSDDQPGDVIGVIQTARLGEADAVTHFTLGEKAIVAVDWLQWATPSRLLIGVSLTARVPALSSKKTGMPLGSRVYSVNFDGSDPVVLFSNASNARRYAYNLARVVDAPANDPEHVIMPGWTGVSYDLFSVNILTGTAIRIVKGNRDTVDWDAEDGHAALRYDINGRGTVVSVYGRVGEQDDWSLLTSYKRNEDKLDWKYAGDAPGAGQIYVRARRKESDTEAIYRYNIATKTFEDLVAAAPGFDMHDALTVNGKYLGASYIADRFSYILADTRQQKHLSGIDAYFRREANVHIVAADRTGGRLLLYVIGPKEPGDYYFYDVERANLQFLMSARPWLEPERLAPMESRKSPTRDGAEITTYLTWPSGERTNLPVIVMPHGGPESRDSIGFDAFAQSFAAQGWLVVQPNFRGSGGYGKAFAQAGYRQWSARMQDDVTDAVNDLVGKGIADRARIVIYGASYGGYAALAGAIVTPDLYRAAVSQSGVTDLMEILAWHRKEDGADSESYSYWVDLIGDPKKDTVSLRAASPRLRAGEVRIPVLLIHGALDGIVPIKQSQIMERALRKAGKEVRMITYNSEGHGGWSYENEVSALHEIITFLRPHLAQPENGPANAGR